MFAQRVVDGAEEAVPEPGVIFSCEVGCIVWEFLGGRRRAEDFWRGFCEDSEELRTCVGWKGNVGYGRRVSESGRDGQSCGEDEGEMRYLQLKC